MNNTFKPTLATRPRARLCAPSVDLADPLDGLLRTTDLDSPIKVRLPVWEGAKAGDSYQLTWDQVPVGARLQITTGQQPGDPLSAELPALTSTADGVYQLSYLIRPLAEGAEACAADATPIIVDRTPPGGAILAAPILPQNISNSLNAARLRLQGDELVATIPGYFGMQWGDRIQSQWGRQTGPSHIVRAAEVGSDQVRLRVERAFLEQLGDGEHELSYRVCDRAGNLSVESQCVTLKLQLAHEPADLCAPIVPQAEKGWIQDIDARFGVRVLIPTYQHAAIGDEVSLIWGDSLLPPQVINMRNFGLDPMLEFILTYPTLARYGDGPVDVRYNVRRHGQLYPSPSQEIQVFLQQPGPQNSAPQSLVNDTLVAPLIQGKGRNAAFRENHLNAQDCRLSANAIIAWCPDFGPDDLIQLFWGEQKRPLVQVITRADAQIAQGVVIHIPNSVICRSGPGQIEVYYTRTSRSHRHPWRSPSQQVRVIFQSQLPGGETGLAAPLFTTADEQNIIDPEHDRHSIHILIAPYLNMQVGDELILSVQGFDAMAGGDPIEGTALQLESEVRPSQVNRGVSFFLSDMLATIHRGRIEAHYQVSSPLGQSLSLKADALIDCRRLGPPH